MNNDVSHNRAQLAESFGHGYQNFFKKAFGRSDEAGSPILPDRGVLNILNGGGAVRLNRSGIAE